MQPVIGLCPLDGVVYVTFATHVESDDWVRAMVFEGLVYQVTVCFNAAAQVVAYQ